jgi:hypothetical protein
MLREDFVREYMQVCSKTFKPTTIIAAFWKSGCWPVNCDIFTDEDFAPSIPTSTSAHHVPSSFPIVQVLDGHNEDCVNESQASQYPERDDSDGDSESESSDDDDGVRIRVSSSKSSQTHEDTPHPISELAVIPTSQPATASAAIAVTVTQPLTQVAPAISTYAYLPPLLSVPVASSVPPGFHMSPTFLSHELVSKPIPLSGRVSRRGTGGHPISVQSHLNALSQAYVGLQEQNRSLCSENSMLRAHCTMAGTEIQDL